MVTYMYGKDIGKQMTQSHANFSPGKNLELKPTSRQVMHKHTC